MIAIKEEFIERYMEKLNHKILLELKEKLPDSGFFMEMIVMANEIVDSITKEDA